MTEIEVIHEDPTPSTMLQEMRNMMSSMKKMCANVQQVLPAKYIEPEVINSHQPSSTSEQFDESSPTVNCTAFNFLSGNISCCPAEYAKSHYEIVSRPFTEVASCFNRFFSTIGSTLPSSFIRQPLPLNNTYSDHDSLFSFNDITVDFTMKQLSQLNTRNQMALMVLMGDCCKMQLQL